MEAVATVLEEDTENLEELGLNPNVYRRNAIQATFELCLQGGDSMRVAGATVGAVQAMNIVGI